MTEDHIILLKAFDELPFNLGKMTFISFLKGDINPTIEKNNLMELRSYGLLFKSSIDDLSTLIDALVDEDYLEFRIINGAYKVLQRTRLGAEEIIEKKFELKIKGVSKLKSKFNFNISEVDEKDLKLFEQFSFFLESYNDEQKKAIISPSQNILTLAGAGSGKTTVLTKRVEFLNKFRGVDQSKILAITFTRKAREEMQKRLEANSIHRVRVETFNSFCEKILKKHSNVKVATFADKIALTRKVMEEESVSLDEIAEDYFNKRQLREKSLDDLFFSFINDIFTIIDFYKNREEEMKEFYMNQRNPTKRRVSKALYEVAKGVSEELKKRNLRDFTDQILDCLKIFREDKEKIPKFEHILVDEFQDLNLIQFELLKCLNSPNTFAVGDPRQAIYAWRGSDIKYILDFPNEFKDSQILSLNKNYRSTPEIINLINSCIKTMGLDDLQATSEKESEKGQLFLIEQDNEELERIFVSEAIKNSQTKRSEIFVLARTNRILTNLSDHFKRQKIPFTIKGEEGYEQGEPDTDTLTLATVHAIKGMEAKEIYLVSANSLSFPNKVADNFVLSDVKESVTYDKEFEELRLFYVALSRAKEKLVITYTGTPSKFINTEMKKFLNIKNKNKDLFSYAEAPSTSMDTGNSDVLKNLLKNWRSQKSKETGMPVYMILSNTAIDELARLRPQTKDDLYNIKGFGSVTIAKYGDLILKIING